MCASYRPFANLEQKSDFRSRRNLNLSWGSSRVTLDVYTPAQMAAQRAAQQKVVALMRRSDAAMLLKAEAV
jgi:hypothetical protein